ncbi:MAG: tRNA lysidine(34) synthetase TilS [Acidimicrobiales bacterium]
MNPGPAHPSAGLRPEELLARCRFPGPGTAVACAVSGGADSLALLLLAVTAGCAATAIHVDHGLRSGSAEEAKVVAEACRRLGAGFVAHRVEVGPGPNLEARARSARYRVLPAGVLTGHTADDQAETILLNLIRGAGRRGMAGMRDDGRRPLLGLRRSETRALCQAKGLSWVDDPSNDDLALRRNRVRHQLLPLLDEIAGRDVVPVLTRQAELFAEEDDLLDTLSGAIDPTDTRAMTAAAVPLARRAVRSWLEDRSAAAHPGPSPAGGPGPSPAGGPVPGPSPASGHPPDSATVQRVLEVAAGRSRATDVGRGWRVERTGGRLRLVVRSAP